MLITSSSNGILRPRRRQPGIMARVDASHPLTKDMKAAVLFHRGLPVNYISGQLQSLVSATPPTFLPDINGPARSYVRASSAFDEVPAVGTTGTDFYSWFASVTMGTFAAAENHTLFNNNGSSTAAGTSVRIAGLSSSTFNIMHVSNGAAATIVSGTMTASPGMYLGGTLQSTVIGNTFAFLNGIQSASPNAPGISASINGPLRIGGRSDNFLNAQLGFFYLWWGNRQMLMPDFMQLYDDPFQIFQEQRPRKYYIGTASAVIARLPYHLFMQDAA